MFTPRNLAIAGIALSAVGIVGMTTGSTHVFWALFGLCWVFGGRDCTGRRHERRRHHTPIPDSTRDTVAATPGPDPNHDRHVAFPEHGRS
ncbi:MAG: hypothetical protein L0H25_07420 [Micrococcales bacterium]|nr:hypothetical protein [Micrococcales bacterium]